MKQSVGFAVLLGALCSFGTREVRAQDFAGDGRVVIGAERLTGLFIENVGVVSTQTITPGVGMPVQGETETDISTTSVALLGGGTGFLFGDGGSASGGPSMTPRLGVDVFVASGFSVGGSLMFLTSSGTLESNTSVNGMPDDDPEDEDQPTSTLLIVAPRVGYGYAVSPSFAIWPRVGFSYTRYGASQEDEDTDAMGNTVTVEESQALTFTNLTLELMMAVTPIPNVAILFGPFADLGLGGGFESEQSPDLNPAPDAEIDAKYTAFGLSAGIGIVF